MFEQRDDIQTVRDFAAFAIDLDGH
jgi:hypothetical protein